jgi:hypothetical protein
MPNIFDSDVMPASRATSAKLETHHPRPTVIRLFKANATASQPKGLETPHAVVLPLSLRHFSQGVWRMQSCKSRGGRHGVGRGGVGAEAGG